MRIELGNWLQIAASIFGLQLSSDDAISLHKAFDTNAAVFAFASDQL
jgi:hypothetical protein